MKILQIGKYYHPYHGGIETALKTLSEGLVLAGHSVTVLCYSQNSSHSDEIINGVRVVRVGQIAHVLSQPIAPKLFQKMLDLSQDCDLVHLHTPNPLAEIISLWIDPSIPLVTTFHSDIVRQKISYFLYQPFFRKFLSRMKRVIVPTRWHILNSPILRNYESKCTEIPFGIEAERFDLNAVESHPDLASGEIPTFLFIGRMVEYKGIEYLLQSVAKSRVNLRLIGTGPLKKSLQELARRLGILDKVEFLGEIKEDAAIVSEIKKSAGVVLPSVSQAEAFGMVLLEGMACGKPVITTNLRSGVNFVNEAGVTGLSVPPKDVKALANALDELGQNKEMRLAMGKAARERFLKLFTTEKMIQKTLEVYQDISS